MEVFQGEKNQFSKPAFRQISVDFRPSTEPLTGEEIKQVAKGVTLQNRSYKNVIVIYE